MNPARQRFYDHLDRHLYCSNDKASWDWIYKDRTDRLIEKVRFVHMPTHRRNYVALDIDVEGGAAIWWWEGFLEPTITIITPESSHCKFLYELKNPVLYPATAGKSTINISPKPIRFFERVKIGLDQAMGGDKNYHGPAISNPLSSHFKVHWADKTYSLKELAEYCAVVPREYNRKAPDIADGRHMYLFHTLRVWAYPQARKVKTYEELYAVVKAKAEDIFYNEISCMVANHPYRLSEAMSAVRSITKFIWERKDDPHFKQYMWNKGAMKFQPINYDGLSREDIAKIYHRRQSAGAVYTAEQKRLKTRSKIRNAIEHIVSTKGMRLTLVNISKVSGLSYRTVGRYKDFINGVKKGLKY